MDNQLNMFSPVADSGRASSNAADSFGCCSRFRQCSDAGRCLIPNVDYSAGCSYRKSLESGKVYYGKNAVGFSLSDYHDFCAMVEDLPEDVRTEYFRILVHFWFSEFAASSVLWDASPALLALSDAGLCELAPCVDRFLSMCSDKKLRNRLSESDVYGPAWKKVPAGENGEKRTNAFLCAWIKANAAPFLSLYTNSYALVSLNCKYRSYAYEYYCDYLRGHENRYAVTLPRERDDFELFNG